MTRNCKKQIPKNYFSKILGNSHCFGKAKQVNQEKKFNYYQL